MRFDPERCLSCGTPVRPTNLKSVMGLPPDGTVPNHHFWFCSDECLVKATDDYLPPRFSKVHEAEDSPEYKELRSAIRDVDIYDGSPAIQRLLAFSEKWEAERTEALRDAYIRMFARLDAEYKKILEDQLEKLTKDNARELAAITKEAEKAEAEAAKMIAKAQAKDEELREAQERIAAQMERTAPRPIPERLRFQHTHILAPSGFGKTTLLQQIILEDLEKDDPPGYVIIDPKGLMVERIARLAVFNGRLRDRLVIIDPTGEPPALSMFSMPHDVADPKAHARILNHLIETFAYIFSSSEARLTQRQTIPFAYVVRLIFSMRGDINSLMDLLESAPNDKRFTQHIQVLSEQDQGARRFFANDFHSKTFSETRMQIKTRLYEIISKPELMEMFAAPVNNFSLFDAIQHKKIVLVNTAMGQLGSKASSLLGRYFIAMTLNAAFSRFALPKDEWHPAYLVIDEFQDFADEEKTPELLRLAREYNLGVILAHQTMHSSELNEALRTAISTNTNIKYSSNPEGVDLNYMARDMRCDAEFLKRNASPSDTHARFACFARGMGLEHPFLVEVPFGNIQDHEQMSDADYEHLKRSNSSALSQRPVSVQEKPQPEPKPPYEWPQKPTPPKPKDDTHSEGGSEY